MVPSESNQYEVVVDGETLLLEDVEAVARDGAPVRIAADAREAVRHSRERVVDVLDADDPVYGVNTGFGSLVDTQIPAEDLEVLQTNLPRSHVAGTGREFVQEEVHALVLTRLNAPVKGYSEIRERVVDLLASALNEGVHPVVRSRGSLGASGDLAPLAHLGLVLIGEGEARVDGDRLPGNEALERAGLSPVTLEAKEGLALINGTQPTTGVAALALLDAERALRAADAAGALTTEVTMSATANCDPVAPPCAPPLRPGGEHTQREQADGRLRDR